MAKKNMRNEFEFMASVLDALGVDYEEADIKVRERWRGKVLDGWGVSYIPDDLKQFERWRKKCIEGLSKNSGGGGGGGSVTSEWVGWYSNNSMSTQAEGGENIAHLSDDLLDADSIKVTFDGVEYELERELVAGDNSSDPLYAYVYGETTHDSMGFIVPDFTNYPFSIIGFADNGTDISVQDSGTHAVSIEVPDGQMGVDSFDQTVPRKYIVVMGLSGEEESAEGGGDEDSAEGGGAPVLRATPTGITVKGYTHDDKKTFTVSGDVDMYEQIRVPRGTEYILFVSDGVRITSVQALETGNIERYEQKTDAENGIFAVTLYDTCAFAVRIS